MVKEKEGLATACKECAATPMVGHAQLSKKGERLFSAVVELESVRVSWGRGWVSEGKRRAEAIGERKGTSVVRQFGFCI